MSLPSQPPNAPGPSIPSTGPGTGSSTRAGTSTNPNPNPNPTSTSNPLTNHRSITEARLALEASMSNIGSSLDSTLQSRAQNLHQNSSALTKQQDSLSKEVSVLKKENDKLGKLARDMEKQLKELGNVQNWAEMLERDFLVLEETVRRVERGSEDEGSWSGSSWSGSFSGDEREGEGESVRKDGKGDGDGDVEMGGTESEAVAGSNMATNGAKGKEIAHSKYQGDEHELVTANVSDPAVLDSNILKP